MMGKIRVTQKGISYSFRKRLKTGLSLLLSAALVSGLITFPGQKTTTAAKAAEGDKVLFADFEDDACNNSGNGNRITQDVISPNEVNGKQALKYARNSANNVWEVQIKPVKAVSGSAIDASGMTKIVVDVKDTQGSNNFALKLIDSSGKEKETWGASATQDVWSSISFDLSNYSSVNLASVSRINIYEWNDGDYYIDNIHFEDDAGNKVMFQDFEDCVYINNSQFNSITGSEKKSGSNSLLFYQSASGGGNDAVIEAADKDGIDAADKDYLSIWIKDTVGSNNFELLLTDADGGTSKSGFWTSGKPVKDEWTEILVPMSELLAGSTLDVSKITKVKIWEWNSGNYYIDDLYFTDSLSVPAASRDPDDFCTSAFDLVLTSFIEGASIYYTLDDPADTTDPADPTEATGTLYTAPITIDKDTTVKAIAVRDGQSSGILTLAYRFAPAGQAPKAYLQDFEGSPSVTNGKIVTDIAYAYTGSKAALYTVSTSGDPSADTSFYVEGSPADATYYSYLVFWLKDTQGSNTVKLQLKDEAGNTTNLGWMNTLTTENGGSAKNSWTEYAVKLKDIDGIGNIDRGRIKGIWIGEWNSGDYYIDDIYFTNALLPAAPSSNYSSGTYGSITNLTLTAAAGCAIYFTEDGSIPAEDPSLLYTGPIASVENDTTIKAIAVRAGDHESSRVAAFTYRIKPLPASGLVSFNTFDSGIDAVTPANGAQISLSTDEKYHGDSGLKYEMTTLSGTPTTGARSITIRRGGGESSADARLSRYLVFWAKDMQGCNNTFMYLRDDLGNEASGWTICSTRYGEWSRYYVDLSSLSGSSGLDFAYLTEITFGFYNTGTYYIDEVYFTDHLYSGLPAGGYGGITLSPGAGEVLSSVAAGTESTVFQTVELAAEDGATIYYTTDGTDPAASAARKEYSKAIYLTATTTIQAVAVKDGILGNVYSFSYTVKPAKVFAIYGKPGTYDGSVIVALRSSLDDTPVCYTLDGSTPDYHSTRYVSAFRIEESCTLKAIAYTGTEALNYSDGEFSEISELEYVITGTESGVSKPRASCLEGTYGRAITVALTSKTAGAAIYYTVNGTTPSANSRRYTGPITVSGTMTIKAIAIKDGTASDVSVFRYIIATKTSNFLKADGKTIKNNYGTGDEVILRGTNAGGWLVTESWMTPVDAKDQLTTINTFTSRFGEGKAWELINIYQDHWWTEDDFDLVKAEGINLLRLPFTYMDMQNSDGTLKASAFARLDWFIEEAKQRDIYVMLDLHGAPGSQNGKDHSGDTTVADIGDFYGNEENIEKTIALWEAIAARYKDEPMVCGYDLLNEPAATGLTQFEVYDQIYDAIRAIDKNHMIFIEAVWDPADLPSPSLYEWKNVVYEYHFYEWSDLTDADKKEAFIRGKAAQVNAADYDVPTFIGEFTFFANTESWQRCLALFEQEGWSWTTWTWKVTGIGSSWGLYTGAPAAVAIAADDEATIRTKWSNSSTAASFTRNTAYADVIKTFFAKNAIDGKIKVPYGTQPADTSGGSPSEGSPTPTPTPTPALTPVPEAPDTIEINFSFPEGDGEADLSALKLDRTTLEAAKKEGRSIRVTVTDADGRVLYSWTFRAKDLANADITAEDINLALTAGLINNRADLIKLLGKKNAERGIVIDFRHSGILPAQAEVKIYVGDLGLKYKDKVYLYYYDVETGKLLTLPHSSYKVDKDGYIALKLLHCSEYVLSPAEAASGSITSLRNQIRISPAKKTLYVSKDKKNTASITVTLPSTLKLVSSLKDIDADSAAGAVTVTYASSNKKVAAVSKKGKVTAVGKGTATVTVKVTLYSGKIKTYKTKVTVK